MVTIDEAAHEVLNGTEVVDLTPKEFQVLVMLAKAKGAVQTRDKIKEKIWGYTKDMDIDSRTVDQHVARIRTKLGGASKSIVTVTNYGYRVDKGIILRTRTEPMGQVTKVNRYFKGEVPCMEITLKLPHTFKFKAGDKVYLG